MPQMTKVIRGASSGYRRIYSCYRCRIFAAVNGKPAQTIYSFAIVNTYCWWTVSLLPASHILPDCSAMQTMGSRQRLPIPASYIRQDCSARLGAKRRVLAEQSCYYFQYFARTLKCNFLTVTQIYFRKKFIYLKSALRGLSIAISCMLVLEY